MIGKRVFCITLTVFILGCALVGTSQAARRDGPSPLKPKKDLVLEPRQYYLAPYLTGGVLVGSEAAAAIPDRGRRALFGLGARFEYVLQPAIRLGVSGQVLLAKVAESDSSRGRALLAGGSAMFLLHPSRPGSFFGRVEFGIVQVTATKYENGSLGSYPYLRGGIGHQLFSTPTLATRVELYYQMALADGKTIDTRFFRGEIPANAQAVGLELGLAVGL